MNYKPKGFNSITPYITVDGAAKFIEFVKKAFGAEELHRYQPPDSDKIMHAVIKIEDTFIECSDGSAEFPPMPAALHFYVPDVDAVYEKAIKAGGIGKSEPKDQFYGDREAFVKDPCGNNWYLATHIKDITEEELKMHEPASN